MSDNINQIESSNGETKQIVVTAKDCVPADNTDDDQFHIWHISGLDQCGSKQYIKNHSANFYSESFKLLYEQEKKEGADKFTRLYGEDEAPAFVKSKSNKYESDIDDEFIPFKTGIAHFDDKMSGASKSAKDRNKESRDKDKNRISDDSQSVGSTALKKSDSEENQHNGAEESSFSISEAARKRIFEDAYKSGFEEGKIKGYEDGLARGMEEGFQAGHDNGSQEGYDAGFQKGDQEGYDAGFQKGEEDGKVIGDARSLEIINSLEDILHKAENSWQNSIKLHEAKILSMICKIAEKVVFAKVELEESIVKNSILNALEAMPEPEEIILNISPDDYDYVEMVKDDFFTSIKSLKSISVVSNPSIQRGGCKIESSKGNVETDIKTRLEQVFTSIMGARVA
ncbi:MAG: FliH/SctL family protein [Desulfamplus sp.]